MAGPTWFLDLDDTLHDASHAMFGAIDRRMTDFVQQHLGLDRHGADTLRRDLWLRYGATLVGLVRNHGVDPKRFLRETHDFDVTELLRAERGVRRLGRRLPGRKVLLTNAPDDYAARVLRGIGLHRHIDRRYAVEHMRIHGAYRPKPAQALFRVMRVRERLGAGRDRPRPILVDDNLANLKAARAAGFATVLIGRGGPGAGNGYVDARIRSVHQLPRIAARLASRR